MAFLGFLRRRRLAAPAQPVVEAPPPPPPPPPSRLAAVWAGLWAGLDAIDRALCWLALPFGVTIADSRKRHALMLGLFAAIYAVGLLPVPHLPIAALVFGYLGVIGVGRAWARNENDRAAIVKKLDDRDPDRMPDLRRTSLIATLQLFILFPLLYRQLHNHYGLFKVQGDATLLDWLWFAIDKTYLKALPDWSVLYGVHISWIDFDRPWGRHLVLLSRLTFDYILIQGLLRLLAIRATTGEAVAAVKADPEMAVRLGQRAVEPLIEKLRDPDRAVRGAAANALTQLGRADALGRLLQGEPPEDVVEKGPVH